MFASNQGKPTDIKMDTNEIFIDPLTIWLIRISCLLIIILFSGILIGVPIALSFGQSLFNETVLNAKDVLRSLIETSLI